MAEKPTTKKREYSRPSLKKVLVVNSEASINAVETFVKRTMASIYRLDVILFFIADEDVAKQANGKVAEIFAEKIRMFDTEIAKLEAKVSDLGVSEEDMDYSDQRAEEFKIYSPLCATYIKLIMKFERYTNLTDLLWLENELPSSERNKKVRKLRSHLGNVSRQVVNASRSAMAIAQSEGKEEDVIEAVTELGIEADDNKELPESETEVAEEAA